MYIDMSDTNHQKQSVPRGTKHQNTGRKTMLEIRAKNNLDGERAECLKCDNNLYTLCMAEGYKSCEYDPIGDGACQMCGEPICEHTQCEYCGCPIEHESDICHNHNGFIDGMPINPDCTSEFLTLIVYIDEDGEHEELASYNYGEYYYLYPNREPVHEDMVIADEL